MFHKDDIDYFPLTKEQEGLWVEYQKNPNALNYNTYFTLKLAGNLDPKRFLESEFVVSNHFPVSRTKIAIFDGIPYQGIYTQTDSNCFQFSDLTHMESPDFTALNSFKKTSQTPYKLEDEFCFRTHLVKASENVFYFLVKTHHVFVDGYSAHLFLTALSHIYNRRPESLEVVLPQKTTKDYLDYLNKISDKLKTERSLKHWREQLQDADLEYDFSILGNPSCSREEKSSITLSLGKDVIAKAKVFCKSQKTTLFLFYTAILNFLLYKHGNKKDIVTCYPLDTRHPGFKKVAGHFVKTLPMRIIIGEEDTFQDLCIKTKETRQKDRKFEDLPLSDILHDFRISNRHKPSNFNISIGQTIKDTSSLQLENIDATRIDFFGGEMDVDLSILFDPTDIDGNIEIKYKASLFYEGFMDNIANKIVDIINFAIENPHTKLSDLDILTDAEKRKILVDFNNNLAKFPKNKTIHQLFEEQVSKTPDNVAVVFQDQKITYKELNERANQLGHYLRKKGVNSNNLVCLCLDRSIEMIISMLGVLKAGGAYVPLDPDYPQERKQFILEDTGAKILITHNNLIDSHKLKEIECVNLDRITFSKEEINNTHNINDPNDLIYVIYTSGTTGVPKGAMLEHRNIVGLFFSDFSVFDFNDKDTWSMFHSYNFDYSVLEMYGALLHGGKLIIIPKMMTKDPFTFSNTLHEQKVTILCQTPRSFYNLADEMLIHHKTSPKIRTIILAGEALSVDRLKRYHNSNPHVKLINMYGITETTVVSTYKYLTQKEISQNVSNIGTPIPTTKIYILNDHLSPMPIGAIGEIYISGYGVSRGYLNNPDLTKERFIPNPFEDGTMYKSGDLARWLPNGDIEYMGRIDHQLKIRGFRVEIGEIETTMRSYEGINEVHVDATDKDGDAKELIAYFTANKEIDIHDLKLFLANKTPSYMVPAGFVSLDFFPLTSNGKIDRKSLHALTVDKISSENYVAPTSSLEIKLASVWQSILKVDKIGKRDNFFDLGGDSLDAVKLATKLADEGLAVDVLTIFNHPTIDELIPFVQKKGVLDSALVHNIEGEIPLLPTQMWFFNNKFEDFNHWNSAIWCNLKKPITLDVFKTIFAHITKQHDILRARFSLKDGQWTQTVFDYEAIKDTQILFEHHVINFDTYQDEQKAIRDIALNSYTKIDIEKGPLAVVCLFDLKKENRQKLFINVHHLLGDGYSTRVLLGDLEIAFEQIRNSTKIALPPKTTSVKEWVDFLGRYATRDQVTKEINHHLEDLSTPDVLPFDYIKGESTISSQRTTKLFLDKNITDVLYKKVYSRGYNVQDVLLTALVSALKDWKQQAVINLMLAGIGRMNLENNIDLSRTIGFFANWHPLRLDLRNIDDPLEALDATRRQTRTISNEGIDYNALKYFGSDHIRSKINNLPPITTSFNYMGSFDIASKTIAFDQELTCDELKHYQGKTNKCAPFIVRSAKWAQELVVYWSYSTNHFKDSSMQTNMNKYMKELKRLIKLLD